MEALTGVIGTGAWGQAVAAGVNRAQVAAMLDLQRHRLACPEETVDVRRA